MKRVFVPVTVKREPNYEKIEKLIEDIPERKLALCYSNQFIDVAKKIYDLIGDRFFCKMQVLGCSNPKFPKGVEGVLIIGQGKFHSVSLAYESKLPTYILENDSINKIEEKDIEKLEKKEKGAYLGYLNAKSVGILVTSKPGQERLDRALEFKRSLKDKRSYIFVGDSLDISEFDNFGIDFWVNTACPRMDLTDAKLINLDKLEILLNSRD